MFSIRPFDDYLDYPGIVAVWNTAWPEIPRSARQWRQDDALRPAGLRFERLVVEMENDIVGFGELMQDVEPKTPLSYWATLEVLPAYQPMNICAALYSRLLGILQRLDAQQVKTRVRSDQTARIHFLEERGFWQQPEMVSKIHAGLDCCVPPQGDAQASQWLRFEKQFLAVETV